MEKIWLIFKNELISVITRRSFIITLLLVPLVSAVVMIVISILGKNTGSAVGQIFNGSGPQQLSEGYVDQSALVRTFPQDIPQGRFVAFPDVGAARQALSAGKISAYYLVPADYLQTGNIDYVRADFNPLSGLDDAGLFQTVLRYNLLNGDARLLDRVDHPLNVSAVSLSPGTQRDSNSMLTFFLPYIVTMIFYVVILSASGLMLSSITTEKQNRVIEILMVSVTPIQMLAGKIVALGLVGLLQTVVWSGAGFLLLRLSGSALNLPAAFQLPVSILAWGMLFFLLGYAVYASLMAGVGALVPNLREASQATTMMVIPLVIPIVFMGAITQDPNGPLALGLSLFPLTAPVTMMSRLAAGAVPLWQPILAAALLVLTAYLILRSVARMFRAQYLLSGQSFNLKRFVSVLVGKGA
ncbi:MAG TPA: ABC transporter permease [Anaerolineaceae bacterium]|jgi:ABC-2 type transport system permease protein